MTKTLKAAWTAGVVFFVVHSLAPHTTLKAFVCALICGIWTFGAALAWQTPDKP